MLSPCPPSLPVPLLTVGHLALFWGLNIQVSGLAQGTLLLEHLFLQIRVRWDAGRGQGQVSRGGQKWLYQVRNMCVEPWGLPVSISRI